MFFAGITLGLCVRFQKVENFVVRDCVSLAWLAVVFIKQFALIEIAFYSKAPPPPFVLLRLSLFFHPVS